LIQIFQLEIFERFQMESIDHQLIDQKK